MKTILISIALFITLQSTAQDYKALVLQYSQEIKTDSLNPKAYYNRASAWYELNRYDESLSDVNKAILLHADFSQALILRGKLNAQKENKTNACKDFNRAKELGDTVANNYVAQYFCEYKPLPGESLVLDWPENENWKISERYKENNLNMIYLIHSNETIEQWTELAAMCSMTGIKGVDLESEMNKMFEEPKALSKQAKLTRIEKNNTGSHSWLIFSIENMKMEKDGKIESRVYYLIQGNETFYVCYRAVQQKALSQEQKDKWTTFFKTGELVYE